MQVAWKSKLNWNNVSLLELFIEIKTLDGSLILTELVESNQNLLPTFATIQAKITFEENKTNNYDNNNDNGNKLNGQRHE